MSNKEIALKYAVEFCGKTNSRNINCDNIMNDNCYYIPQNVIDVAKLFEQYLNNKI